MQPVDEIARCHGCGALWMAEGTLRELYREEGGKELPELLEHEDGRPSLECPVCGARMGHVFLDMLELDRCPEHGIWLDAGELERILAHRPGPKAADELGFMFKPQKLRKPST